MKQIYTSFFFKCFFLLCTLFWSCGSDNRTPLKHTLPYSYSLQKPIGLQVKGNLSYHILPGKEEALFSLSNRHEENLILPTCQKLLAKNLNQNSIASLQNSKQKKDLERKLQEKLQNQLKNYFLVIDGFHIGSLKSL